MTIENLEIDCMQEATQYTADRYTVAQSPGEFWSHIYLDMELKQRNLVVLCVWANLLSMAHSAKRINQTINSEFSTNNSN